MMNGLSRNTLLLQADVTANDAEDQALLKRFNIFGPPTTGGNSLVSRLIEPRTSGPASISYKVTTGTGFKTKDQSTRVRLFESL